MGNNIAYYDILKIWNSNNIMFKKQLKIKVTGNDNFNEVCG